jgi:hypothetical protein
VSASSEVNFGIISGFSVIAGELMRYLGHEPADHPDVWVELQSAVGDEVLQVGLDVLTEHGLSVRDTIGRQAGGGNR